MRRIALIIVISLLVNICQAQDHLSFMDIPLNCPLTEYCNKLVSTKGLTSVQMTDGEQYYTYEAKKLIGDFYGVKNCSFYVRQHERLNFASSVIVNDTLTRLNEVDKNRIISIHDKQYGKHENDSSDYYYWYTWKTVNGEVEFGVSHEKGFKVYYTDTTELAVRKALREEFEMNRERQTVREICGIPFGSSYEKAEEILENKYGSSSYLSDKNTIVYLNKSYGGILFDRIMFLFQSDGYKSYMNGCVFVLEATSLNDAKEKRDRLYRNLSSKYDLYENVDEDGNKYYYGGRPPIHYGTGLTIDIVNISDKPKKKYVARLMYGRYNYVKEEF
jgi:hypothetical protein